MSQERIDANGYEVEFPEGLELREDRILHAPYKQDSVVVPFVIRGEPGLLEVRFTLGPREDDGKKDSYHQDFCSTLRPAGVFTNFTGRRPELRGELTIPVRLFPIRVLGIRVRNLSIAQEQDQGPPGS